jgi:hypothetical protein
MVFFNSSIVSRGNFRVPFLQQTLEDEGSSKALPSAAARTTLLSRRLIAASLGKVVVRPRRPRLVRPLQRIRSLAPIWWLPIRYRSWLRQR